LRQAKAVVLAEKPNREFGLALQRGQIEQQRGQL